ncbi:twin-arginine translocation pathway signal protein [Pseudomonas sp. ANT_H14]|uniref:twin-arginine translocation pathway signal protein n=1 Tax=unclassified Pseudomonas TaxID=196821 RepID=UPI0011EBF092|nr:MULTISPECIES: twin-arginine translocation pathway signal protein [unclassified Pseudomonas]KAA0950344.1 twin-arginine translocation pathway signal protein [Pseudomonas sp. ANT_H4]KAA0952812.1 twin-arginine translocation pathway signal protein [Pseudomonas sp. ANT_H14]
MNPSLIETPGLSRRGVLKIGLWASAFLATAGAGASLSGCSSSIPASGFAMLRSSDLPFLRAVIPVLLEGVASTQEVAAGIEDTLKKLDYSLQHLSPEMFKLTQQLFDVLGMAITRGPLTGVWGSWENASSEQIRNFLHRWENSYLNLLRMGQGSLLKLVIMAWYFRAQSWAHCGYPGPPNI